MPDISKRLGRLREVIARAEDHVAAQRARVRQAQFQRDRREADKALDLLGVMERVAEEFRAIRAILQARLRQIPDQKAGHVSDALPGSKSLSCPHCGLIASCLDEGASWTIVYDHAAWAQRCQHWHLGSPICCQLPSFGIAGTVH